MKKNENIETACSKKDQIRETSPFASMQILKTFAISKLVLPATTIYASEENIIKRINSVFCIFQWRSLDKVKRTEIVQSTDKEGLNMIDTH